MQKILLDHKEKHLFEYFSMQFPQSVIGTRKNR